MLPSGKVLVSGGQNSNNISGALASAEVYNPDNNTWSPAGSMASIREWHSAIPLPSGKVLIMGGTNGRPLLGGDIGSPFASAERYTP